MNIKDLKLHETTVIEREVIVNREKLTMVITIMRVPGGLIYFMGAGSVFVPDVFTDYKRDTQFEVTDMGGVNPMRNPTTKLEGTVE